MYILGTGSSVPAIRYTNEELFETIGNGRENGAIPGEWTPEKLQRRTKIRERRFCHVLEKETGLPEAWEEDRELHIAAEAAEEAIKASGLLIDEIDGLWFISCTQHQRDKFHFSRTAMDLHKELGLDPDTWVREEDAGCGGFVQVLDMVQRLGETVLIVASSDPSKHVDRSLYADTYACLSIYIFGSGAGACILSPDNRGERAPEILATTQHVQPELELMYFHPVNGDPRGYPAYEIDGRAVAGSFSTLMQSSIERLLAKQPFNLDEVARFYIHQANGRLLEKFVERMGLDSDQVPSHVDTLGNMAAAAIPVLFDQDNTTDLSGKQFVFAAVGAGAQCGAALGKF